ncbi:hypothetical protein [Solibacillus sp. FSL H8-0538]|uniref:hypothetical protein n=1 Tax=Solibacillus sp. FSL H8-0538 TaxID=2921400 RepID=UPI0030F7190B
METIEVEKDGYEIVVTILENVNDDGIVEADAYYKDFELYRILVFADTTEKVVKLATQELLTNHPFEKIIRES